MKARKNQNVPTYDTVSDAISKNLNKIPWIGSYLSRLYLWRFCTFNSMIVGATGMGLSFLLYEGFFRTFMSPFPGGLFFGMVITTLLVFLWNYFWNKTWSLGINAQILTMRKSELETLKYKIDALLAQKFDFKGDRISE